MTVKYRIYIDETGNSNLKNADNPNQRFFSLTGIIISLTHVRDKMHPEIEALKRLYFASHPDEPITLHRKELVNQRNPFQALKDPRVREAFDRDLLTCLREWKYSVITVCIDKNAHTNTYRVAQIDPYLRCMAVLLEEFTFWLNCRNAVGDVMAEARGNKEDKRLTKEFRDLWENGTQSVEPSEFQRYLTSRELKVKLKTANITGLQLADLIAHPSRNEILYEQGLLERELAPFARKVVEVLADKYDRNGDRFYVKRFI